LSIPIP
jgi:hypothetical protein